MEKSGCLMRDWQKYITKQDNLDKAESVFLNAIEKQPKNTDIYEACVQFPYGHGSEGRDPAALKMRRTMSWRRLRDIS